MGASATPAVTTTLAAKVALPPVALAHGGSGSKRKLQKDGTDAAAAKALAVVKAGGTALEGALAGTVVLEDDPRFNAGTGSNIRMDGKTIQMDAACMDGTTGAFGAVAAIERVKNPVLVARQVMDTPHIFIVGDGATRFARAMGHADFYPESPQAHARYEKVKRILNGKEMGDASEAWKRFNWQKAWNFTTGLKEALGSPDTVGCVARDKQGNYAAGISTGGTTITLYGRVGDVPIYGAGIFAGPKGSVACTGEGEVIVKHLVAKSVYDLMAGGMAPQTAVNRAIKAFPVEFDLGIIAISDKGEGGGCNYGESKVYTENMAWSIAR
ncbi:MAG: isoaspartyl peptidase/L-asparaginase [Candidatus Sericytochromatia bacterium]|nr:isoaspartyl peptidase/L-asparaginase [Candidatus Sericytochromatia bacterium]